MYAFQSESTLYSCLNVKELLARNRREIWSLSACNGKFAKLAKWLSVCLRTKWLWVRVPLQVAFILWFSLFSYYIVLRSSNFSVTDINNVYLSDVDWIFSLISFVGIFEVCYSFVGFMYVYYMVHQTVVVFCFKLRRRSAVQFFVFVTVSNVHVCFVFRRRSAVQFFFVFINFSYVHVCFVFRQKNAVQFFFFFCICQF